jgi:hypothetical protein
MSTGQKTIQKLRRKSKAVKKHIDSAWKESDRADERPKVLAGSPGAYKIMKSAERRMDRSFGIDVVSAKPLCAVNMTANVARIVYNAGYGIQLTLPAAVLTFAGFQPGDIVEFLKASPALLGKYLKVLEVTGTTTVVLEDVSAFSIAGVAEVSLVVTVPDVAGSLGGTYFTFSTALDAAKYYVWLDSGLSVDPAPAGLTPIHVVYTSGDSDVVLAGLIKSAITLSGAAVSLGGSGANIIITNSATGVATDAAANTSTFAVSTTTQGITASATTSESGDVVRLEVSSVKKSFV